MIGAVGGSPFVPIPPLRPAVGGVVAVSAVAGDTTRGPTGFDADVGASPDSPFRVEAGRPSALLDFRGVAALQTGAEDSLENQGLTEEERRIVQQLAARDREVRRHEEAHARVGGQYAGAPSYTFERGPDGKSYAVAGSVSIDVSPVPGDPEATAEKMKVVKRAALAPAEPSAQDRQIASRAEAERLKAQGELQKEHTAELRGEDPEQGQFGPPLVGGAVIGVSSFSPAFGATRADANSRFNVVA